MKRLLFCLAFVVLSLGYWQGYDKILKATYTCHVILSEKGDFDTVLYADDTHSQFVFDQKANTVTTEEGYKIKLSAAYYISDYDFQTQEVHANRTVDKVVLSSRWKNDLAWEITDEEKEIAGYKVRKAVAASYGDKKDQFYTGKVTAEHYYGLPGLIVELYYDITRKGYTLKKVEQGSKEDYTFVPLTDENPISKEDMIYNYYHSKEVRAVIKAAKKKKKWF